MSETRAQLDQKIGLLEERARALAPRRLSERFLPDYLAERVIGGVLTVAGATMVWNRWRTTRHRRARIRAAVEAYGRG